MKGSSQAGRELEFRMIWNGVIVLHGSSERREGNVIIISGGHGNIRWRLWGQIIYHTAIDKVYTIIAKERRQHVMCSYSNNRNAK